MASWSSQNPQIPNLREQGIYPEESKHIPMSEEVGQLLLNAINGADAASNNSNSAGSSASNSATSNPVIGTVQNNNHFNVNNSDNNYMNYQSSQAASMISQMSLPNFYALSHQHPFQHHNNVGTPMHNHPSMHIQRQAMMQGMPHTMLHQFPPLPQPQRPRSPPNTVVPFQFSSKDAAYADDGNSSDENKNKPLTEKQKSRRRASQNLASRNYRQRKKEYLTTVESRMETLLIENEKLKRECNESKLLANKLLRENATLKGKYDTPGGAPMRIIDESEDTFGEEMIKAESRIKQLVLELKESVQSGNEDFLPTLKEFYQTLRNRYSIYTNQVKKIVNPCTQAKISILDAKHSDEEEDNAAYDSKWWAQFVADAGVTEEQQRNINELRKQHSLGYQQLRSDRCKLNVDIREFYNEHMSLKHLKSVNDMDTVMDMEELDTKLERLKVNIDAEKAIILATYDALSKILTPKQEAILVIGTYNHPLLDDSDNIAMIGTVWELLNRRGWLLSKCCVQSS